MQNATEQLNRKLKHILSSKRQNKVKGWINERITEQVHAGKNFR